MPTQEMITCPMLTFPRNLHWRRWPNSPATPPPSGRLDLEVALAMFMLQRPDGR